jgi:hypothetical protein
MSYHSAAVAHNGAAQDKQHDTRLDYALDRPDLRQSAFAWTRRDFIAALTSGKGLRGHWVDLLYSLAAALYVALIAALAIFLCARFAYPWMARALPDVAAMGLAGLLAGVIIVLSVCGVFGSSILPATAERSKLRNMQLGAWTTES